MSRKKRKFEEDAIPKALQKRQNHKQAKKELKKDYKKDKKNLKKEYKHEKKSFKKKIKKILLLIVLVIILNYIIWEAFKTHQFKTMAMEMIINKNSEVVDTQEKTIANIGSEKIKLAVEPAQIPQNLKNAYIAIEDQRFYNHHGIDLKRTASAIVSYVIHFGSSKFGGSTITQQLAKNMTGDDSTSISRKVNEWFRALALENSMSKEEIINTYLNIIYVGPNIYGVQTGTKFYFDKNVSDLSLEECAFLAGLNHSPKSYNPFGEQDRTEKITKRTKTVLNKMLELKYITQEEYNTAVSNTDAGLKFSQGEVQASGDGVYSYHTDALINELVSTLSSQKHISTTFATNYLNMAGLKIHSCQDTNIQSQIEKEFAKGKYILRSNNDPNATSQAAMVIIDHTNGNVIGCVGGLGKKSEARSLNRATQTSRQTGSAIKPVAILGPALQEKIITPVTEFDDSPSGFDIGKEKPYTPIDYDPYLGTITVRRAVESSQNIPFVKMMEKLTPAKSIKYMKKLGITTLTEKDNNLPLALGGLEKGMTPLETAAAYATIANDGEYISPSFYTTIVNSKGKTVLTAKHKKRRVFSEATCYVLKQLLTQPVHGSHGTATYCSISGMDVAAKTGTTNDNYDRWLCGFTPYYTAATWYGFDKNESINFSGKNPAGLLWAYVMNSIHSSLSNKKFEMPKSGVTAVTICTDTNKLANSGCPNRFTEYFVKGTAPDSCSLHSGSTNNVTSNKNAETTTKSLQDEDVPDEEEPQQAPSISTPAPTPTPSATNTTTNTTVRNTTTTNKNSTTTNTNTNNAQTNTSSNSSVENTTSNINFSNATDSATTDEDDEEI